jgi:hypothetical protein
MRDERLEKGGPGVGPDDLEAAIPGRSDVRHTGFARCPVLGVIYLIGNIHTIERIDFIF